MEFVLILGIIGCGFLLVFGILISLGIIKKPEGKYFKKKIFLIVKNGILCLLLKYPFINN